MALLIFSADSVAASGTLAVVFTADASGQGPCRLTIKNAGGSNDLSAAQILLGPDSDHLAITDSTTFATLGHGVTGQLEIDRPVNVVRFLATCASGTTLDIRLARALMAD